MKLKDIKVGTEYALRWSPSSHRSTVTRVRVEEIVLEMVWRPTRGEDVPVHRVRVRLHHGWRDRVDQDNSRGYEATAEYKVQLNQIWMTWADYEARRARAREVQQEDRERREAQRALAEDARAGLADTLDGRVDADVSVRSDKTIVVKLDIDNADRLADMITDAHSTI